MLEHSKLKLCTGGNVDGWTAEAVSKGCWILTATSLTSSVVWTTLNSTGPHAWPVSNLLPPGAYIAPRDLLAADFAAASFASAFAILILAASLSALVAPSAELFSSTSSSF